MELVFTKTGKKDYEKILEDKHLSKVAYKLLELLERNPFEYPPSFKKLSGGLSNFYSRRINKQHRLVYEIDGNQVVVISMWSHYEF